MLSEQRPSERFEKNVLPWLLFFSIALANLRVLAFGLLRIPEYARISLVLPLLILGGVLLLKIVREKHLGLVKVQIPLLIGYLGTLVYLGNELYQKRLDFFFDVIPHFSSTALFILFPILLISVSTAVAEFVLVRVGLVIIWVGAPILIGLNLLDPHYELRLVDQLRIFLLPDTLVRLFGSTYMYSSIRNFGHLGDLAASSAALGALGFFFVLYSIPQTGFRKGFFILSGFLGVAAVYFSTSIWNYSVLLASIVALGAVGFLVKAKWRFSFLREGLLMCLFLLSLSYFFENATFSIPNRIYCYLRYNPQVVDKFVPPVKSLDAKLWRNEVDSQESSYEYHFLGVYQKSGLIPSFGWIFFVFSLFYFCGRAISSGGESLALFGGALFFFAASFHYDAVSFWGNNYLFALFLIAQFHIHLRRENSAHVV